MESGLKHLRVGANAVLSSQVKIEKEKVTVRASKQVPGDSGSMEGFE